MLVIRGQDFRVLSEQIEFTDGVDEQRKGKI
jgi:hypothetical protein